MKLKVLLIFSISILLFISKSDKTKGCSDEDLEDENTYLLFSPKTISKEDYSPFFFTFHKFFHADFDNDSIKKSDNIQDWIKQYKLIDYIRKERNHSGYEADNNDNETQYSKWEDEMDNSRAIRDIESVVYKTSLKEIEEIVKYTKGLPNKLYEYSGKYNCFLNYITENKLYEVIDYVQYARKCDLFLNGEPENKQNEYRETWLDEERKERTIDSTQFLVLAKNGESLIKQSKSDYIKMRYVYQITRLLHYSNNFSLCAKSFDKLTPKTQVGSFIYYWALGHKAAALMKLKDIPQANYLYSQIFANCRSKRLSAFQSVAIDSQSVWDASLAYCKNPREKSVFYAMRGINFQNDATVEMDSIYNLDPNSEFLELLLSREITKLEYSLMNIDYRPVWKDTDVRPCANKQFNETNLLRLKAFVGKMLADNRIIRKPLWGVADGYLEFMHGDAKVAEQKILNCEKYPNIDSSQASELKCLRLALMVRETKIITDSLESQIFDEYQDVINFNNLNESEDDMTLKYVMDRLAYTYYKQGDYGKSFLCSHNFDDIYSNPKEKIVISLINFVDKPIKNEFEQFLYKKATSENLEWYAYRLFDNDYVVKDKKNKVEFTMKHTNIKAQLLEVKGTIELNQGKYKEAIESFSQINKRYLKESEYFKIKADPFYGYFEGAYNFEFSKYSKDSYNKLTFAKKMAELEGITQTSKDTKALADAYFKMGNAYLNTSYFGSCWQAIDYYHSYYFADSLKRMNDSLYTPVSDKEYYSFCDEGDTSYLDQSKAIAYFKKALELAGDNEFKARITFMLAKCELNNYLIQRTEKDDESYYLDFFEKSKGFDYLRTGYLNIYDELKKKYSNTQFYKEALSNCIFFSNYITKN